MSNPLMRGSPLSIDRGARHSPKYFDALALAAPYALSSLLATGQHAGIECQADSHSSVSTDCTVAWGVCNHAFHFHCISRWLTTRSVCPLDNQAWDFQVCACVPLRALVQFAFGVGANRALPSGMSGLIKIASSFFSIDLQKYG
jgi:hypothetical protein